MKDFERQYPGNHWGSESTMQLFDRWSRVQVTSGIYAVWASVAQRNVSWYKERDPETYQVQRRLIFAELPLIVSRASFQYEGHKYGWTPGLSKVNPSTGVWFDGSHAFFGVMFGQDGRFMGYDESWEDNLTEDQIELIRQQQAEQADVGLLPPRW